MRTSVMTRVLGVAAVTLLFAWPAGAPAAEYRAFWVDAWGAGFLNQSQVDNLLGVVGDPNSKGTIRNNNCNAVFVQVRRRADVCYPSGMGEPYFSSGLSPSDFNALQAMINAAHDTTGGKKRIEVHCWVVAFKTAKGIVYNAHNDTPTGNLINFDNYWPTRLSSVTGAENSDGAFDPGHPMCEKYLADVCMDLVNNFDIDGIHYDYIRFEAATEGFNPTSVARYKQRYNLSTDPVATDEQFKQWRRDQVSAFVRQVYARIQASKPLVKQSGSFVTWNPSPTSSTRSAFQNTRPYYDVYSDWDSWMQEGLVDMAVPMTYYNYASLPSDWTRWMNFEKDRKFNRHMIVGPGIYLNSLSNAILEIQQTRNASPAGNYAEGFSGYSYREPYSGGTWANFAPQLLANVTQVWDDVPAMPWKTAPTKGHISGTVTIAGSGAWADHAIVSITGPTNRTMYVDGTGFYAFIDLPTGNYTITASKSGYTNATTTANVQIGAVTGNMYVRDMQLGTNTGPAISGVQAGSVTTNSAVITWTTDSASSSRVEYGTTPSYGSMTPLDSTPVTSHSVALSGLTAKTLYYYRVISANANGSSTSNQYTFTTSGPPAISNVQVSNITNSTATITWTTDAPSTSQVNYGLTSSYGSQTPLDSTLVTSHSVTLTGLQANTTYHYQTLSTNSYGSVQSTDATFSTISSVPDVIVDNTDPNCTVTGTAWTTGTASAHIGADYIWTYCVAGTSEASATATARWTPTLTAAGNYDVYIYYTPGTNRSVNTYWKINNAGSTRTYRINQELGGGWSLLDSNVPFNAGTAGYVQAMNNSGESTQVLQVDAVKWVFKGATPDTEAPSVPTEVNAVATGNSIQVTWTASFDNIGVTGYKVYRNGTFLTNVAGTSHLDSGLTPNTSYGYEISAYDAAGNESAKAAPQSRVTLPVAPSPSTVTCDKASGAWYSTNGFTFTAVGGFGPGGVTKYKYVWDTSSTHVWTEGEPDWSAGTLARTATSGGAWYLHLRSYNSEGAAGGTLDLGFYGYDITAPAAAVVTDDGGYTTVLNALHASWMADDAESGISKYEYRVRKADGTVVVNWTDVGTATDADVTGLTLAPRGKYFFDVRATNAVNMVGPVGSSDGIVIFPYDVDGSTTVDEIDFEVFTVCAANGANLAYPTNIGFDCGLFDVEADGDNDLDDFAVFQRCYTGAGAIDPTCLE